jgi:hypothetical protein
MATDLPQPRPQTDPLEAVIADRLRARGRLADGEIITSYALIARTDRVEDDECHLHYRCLTSNGVDPAVLIGMLEVGQLHARRLLDASSSDTSR